MPNSSIKAAYFISSISSIVSSLLPKFGMKKSLIVRLVFICQNNNNFFNKKLIVGESCLPCPLAKTLWMLFLAYTLPSFYKDKSPYVMGVFEERHMSVRK